MSQILQWSKSIRPNKKDQLNLENVHFTVALVRKIWINTVDRTIKGYYLFNVLLKFNLFTLYLSSRPPIMFQMCSFEYIFNWRMFSTVNYIKVCIVSVIFNSLSITLTNYFNHLSIRLSISLPNLLTRFHCFMFSC